MWTVEFIQEKGPIGTLIAFWSKGTPDEFAYKWSVNVDELQKDGGAAFVAQAAEEARAALAKVEQPDEDEQAFIALAAALTTALNKA